MRRRECLPARRSCSRRFDPVLGTALSLDGEMQPFRINAESKSYLRQMLPQLMARADEVCFAHITLRRTV